MPWISFASSVSVQTCLLLLPRCLLCSASCTLLHNGYPWSESLPEMLQKPFTLSEQQCIKECRETFVIMCIYNLSARLVFIDDYWGLSWADLPPQLGKLSRRVSCWLTTFLTFRSSVSYRFHRCFFHFAWSKSLGIKYTYLFYETACFSAFKCQKTKIKWSVKIKNWCLHFLSTRIKKMLKIQSCHELQ